MQSKRQGVLGELMSASQRTKLEKYQNAYKIKCGKGSKDNWPVWKSTLKINSLIDREIKGST